MKGKEMCTEIINDREKTVDSAVDPLLYPDAMGESKTKAEKLTSFLDEMTVEGLDDLLLKMGRDWMRVYMNRQMLANEQGNTTPAPAPPRVELAVPEASAREGDEQEQAAAPKNEGNAGLTLAALVDQYRTHKRSPYHTVKFTSRRGYDRNLNRIVADRGNFKLAELRTKEIQGLYDLWTAGGTHSMGYSLITQLRMLFAFGATVLEDSESVRLSVILRNLNFSPAKRQSGRLTMAHVVAIIKKAHDDGVHSIALAQAFQFGCKLRQNEIIGEWAPLSEPGDPIVKDGNEKWLRGLLWPEIDPSLILRHPGHADINLRDIPLVMAELNRIGIGALQKKKGPIIVDEETELPYQAWKYRRRWREIATAAGVPPHVKSILTGTLKASSAGEPIISEPPMEDLAPSVRH